jgi:hypothetical protein
MVWKSYQCSPKRGPALPSGFPTPSPIRVSTTCIAFDLIDASTGDDLGLEDTNATSDVSAANNL